MPKSNSTEMATMPKPYKTIQEQNDRLSRRLAAIRREFIGWQDVQGEYASLDFEEGYDRHFAERMCDLLNIEFDTSTRTHRIKGHKAQV